LRLHQTSVGANRSVHVGGGRGGRDGDRKKQNPVASEAFVQCGRSLRKGAGGERDDSRMLLE
jgi:hypothetical protein